MPDNESGSNPVCPPLIAVTQHAVCGEQRTIGSSRWGYRKYRSHFVNTCFFAYGHKKLFCPNYLSHPPEYKLIPTMASQPSEYIVICYLNSDICCLSTKAPSIHAQFSSKNVGDSLLSLLKNRRHVLPVHRYIGSSNWSQLPAFWIQAWITCSTRHCLVNKSLSSLKTFFLST
jgi:hypothetical protein